MLIIPVIDLRNGQAVRAIAGQRDRYQPLSSGLCPHSEPAEVVQAYGSLYPFSVIYLADLDAIEKTGSNRAIVEQLLERFSTITFWLDAGFSQFDELAWINDPRLRPVLGSESQTDLNAFKALLTRCAPHHPLLSLDFKNGRFLGPPDLLDAADAWPRDMILMNLDRVGANRGPDTGLERFQAIAQNKRFFAAGGVRGSADLEQLAATGYAGVLVASALHDGQLSQDEIATFMNGEV